MPPEESSGSSPVPEGDEVATPPASVDDAALREALERLYTEQTGKALQPYRPEGPETTPTDEASEDEPPTPMAGNPVLAKGDSIELKREGTRSQLAIITLCLFSLLIAAYVVASFRLEPGDQVRELREMIMIMLPVTVGALAAFYFNHRKSR